MDTPNNSFTLKTCLFGTVKVTKNAGKIKFTYNNQETAFDGKGMWSYENDFAKTVIVFGADNTLSIISYW